MDANRLHIVRDDQVLDLTGALGDDDREISVLISDETFDRLVTAIERGLTPRAGLGESVFDE